MMYNSSHQLLMQTLPVVYALAIINAKAIHRALDGHIQHLQLLLEESLLAPVRLLDEARAFGHTMLIRTRDPAIQNTQEVRIPCLLPCMLQMIPDKSSRIMNTCTCSSRTST